MVIRVNTARETFISACSKRGCAVDSKLLCLEDGKEHVAIGTIYKDMKLKPTVLKEYTEEQTMAQQLAADTFCDDDDGLVLEDDSARIRLSGAVSADTLTTGVVAAVFGTYDAKAGALHVKELAFAGVPTWTVQERGAAPPREPCGKGY